MCEFVSVRACAPLHDSTAVATKNSLRNSGVVQLLVILSAAAVCLYHTVSF